MIFFVLSYFFSPLALSLSRLFKSSCFLLSSLFWFHFLSPTFPHVFPLFVVSSRPHGFLSKLPFLLSPIFYVFFLSVFVFLFGPPFFSSFSNFFFFFTFTLSVSLSLVFFQCFPLFLILSAALSSFLLPFLSFPFLPSPLGGQVDFLRSQFLCECDINAKRRGSM